MGRNGLFVLFALILCYPGKAQFTTVAYDGFNYSAGSLNGQNGGTGWASAWVNDYSSGATLLVNATGMFYPGLTNSGGSVTWGPGGNGISEDSRTLPRQHKGVVYVQFLSKFGPGSAGGGTPNIRLADSGTGTGGFGANGGPYASYMSILDASLNAATNGSSSSSISLLTTNLVVARIDYLARKTSMWVNPNLATFDYENPGTAPDATYTNLAPAFDRISIYSRNPVFVDELTVLYEPVQTPAPILNSPISNSTSNNISISYTLPVAPLAGSVQLTFSNNLQTVTLVMANATNVSFVLPLLNPLASPYVISAFPPSATLTDGIYNMVLSYQDANGDSAAAVIATNILLDTITLSPALLAPNNNAVADSSGLHINYLLPETPEAGSVSLTFYNATTNIVLNLDDSLTHDFVVSPGFLTNSAIISATSSTLPDGIYNVQLNYQDTLLNPIAFTSATNVLVDTITQPAMLLAPTNNVVANSAGLHIRYELPEAAAAGSVKIILQNSTTNITLHLNDNLTNDFIVFPGSLTNAAITSATSSLLPDGIYDVQLSYQDALLNPIALTTTTTNVLVDTATQPAILLAPANNVVVNSAGLHINYLLPEIAASGSVKIIFQNSDTNIVLHLNDSLTNDFMVSSQFLTNAAITTATSSALPDGIYDVQLSYQDALLNPFALISSTNIMVDTVTLPAVLLAPTDNATVSSSGLHIHYQLAESPASGSVVITFQNSTTNITLHLNDSLTNDFMVSPGFLLNAAITSATSTVLPDGIYAAQLSYQDAQFNPVSSAGATNLLVDTVTQPPVLLAPANNTVISSAGLHISYQLPEAPASGSVKIIFQNSATTLILHLNDDQTNDFAVSPSSLLNAPAITSATSAAMLDGRYAISLSYQDALLNPAAQASATNVLTVLEQLNFYPTYFTYSNGIVALEFTQNLPEGLGFNYHVMASTNLNTPLSNWSDLGQVTESPPGHFQFQQIRTNSAIEFYLLHVY